MNLLQKTLVFQLGVLCSISCAMELVPTNPPISILTIQTDHEEQLLITPSLDQSPDIVCIQHKGEDNEAIKELEKKLEKNYTCNSFKVKSNLVKPQIALGSTINIIGYNNNSFESPKKGTIQSTQIGLSNWMNIPLYRKCNGSQIHIISAMPKKDVFMDETTIKKFIINDAHQFAAKTDASVIVVADFEGNQKQDSQLIILSKTVAYKLGIQKLKLMNDN
ncbi:MAG: hypothetical protein ACOYT8_05450 [Candidatus Dependentiae bacterium]